MVSGSLAELGPAEAWTAEIVSDGVGSTAEEISQQSVSDIACLFLLLTIKCKRREINERNW